LGEAGILLNASPGFVAVEVMSDREPLYAAVLADPHVEMSRERWWDGDWKGKTEVLKEKLPHFRHFVHHRSHLHSHGTEWASLY
jgi:hypothetical protein